jgi:hypothetical protein
MSTVDWIKKTVFLVPNTKYEVFFSQVIVVARLLISRECHLVPSAGAN